ncbi:MAG: hypothetical protein SFZ24_11755 [Planctomycetota bacterium]|nr:hypothetical protein [Planctomycetota bacterium]
MRSGTTPSLWCALTLAAAVAPGVFSSRASAQPARPDASRRVVQAWDFEDMVSRVEPVPLGWFRAQDIPGTRDRPGFPGWNVPILSTEQASSGQRSVKLPTRGGNTSLMLSGGAVPALPSCDYVVRARVRSEGLTHARASLEAWLLDAELKPIPGSEVSSGPSLSPGVWETLEAPLRGDERAAWIQIELRLSQPASLRQPRHDQEVFQQDYSGAAYFDDVVIAQAPRVELAIDGKSNIVSWPEEPALRVMVRDLTGEALTVALRVEDLEGVDVAAMTMPAPPAGRENLWKPDLPAFGWYRVHMAVSSSQGEVGRRTASFVWTPQSEAPDTQQRHGFGVIAERLAGARRAALPEFLRRTFSGSVTLGVWRPTLAREEVERWNERLIADAEGLLAEAIDITFVLTEMPAELAREKRVDVDDPIPVLLAPDDPWTGYLARVLTSFGERVRRWQLGPTGSNAALFRTGLQQDTDAIRAKLRRMVPRPVITVPWSLERASVPPGVDGASMYWPLGMGADEIRAALDAAGPGNGLERTVVIETPDETLYGRRAAALELARRAISAWAAGVRRLAIRGPWSDDAPDASTLEPTALAGVWRTLSAALADTKVVGTVNIADGCRVYILDGPRGGMLAGWNDSATPKAAVIEGWLGPGTLRAMDPFGNVAELSRDDDGLYRIPLGDMPVFISGVDTHLALFRAGLRFEPGFLAARAQRHEVGLVISNPWPVGVTGRLRLAKPEEWGISPRVIPFQLGPGASVRVPIELVLALGEEAGRRHVEAEVELTAERRYPVQRFPMSLEIGLPTAELLASYRVETLADGAPGDLIVSLLITNLSDQPLTVEAFAHAPGYRGFSAPISALEPGASTTRRFRLEGGAKALAGRSVRVGLKEQDGTGRLNRTLVIE